MSYWRLYRCCLRAATAFAKLLEFTASMTASVVDSVSCVEESHRRESEARPSARLLWLAFKLFGETIIWADLSGIGWFLSQVTSSGLECMGEVSRHQRTADDRREEPH